MATRTPRTTRTPAATRTIPSSITTSAVTSRTTSRSRSTAKTSDVIDLTRVDDKDGAVGAGGPERVDPTPSRTTSTSRSRTTPASTTRSRTLTSRSAPSVTRRKMVSVESEKKGEISSSSSRMASRASESSKLTGATSEQAVAGSVPSKSTTQRSNEAKTTINETLRSLSAAQTSGYRYRPAAPSTSRAARTVKKPAEGEWTDEKVLCSIKECMKAFDELAESPNGNKEGQKLSLEKTRNGVLSKMLALGMFRQSLIIIEQNRNSITNLCGLVTEPEPRRPTGKTAATRKSELTRWIQLLSLPGLPTVHESNSIVFANLMTSWIAWISSVQEEGDLELLVPTLRLILSPAHNAAFPFDLDVDPATVIQYCSNLYARMIKLEDVKLAPVADPTYVQFRVHLSSMCLGPKSIITPAVMWSHAQRSLSRFIAGISQNIPQAAEILVQVLEGVKSRELCPSPFVGKEWTDLLDFWMGLGRKMEDIAVVERALAFAPSSSVAQLTHDVEKLNIRTSNSADSCSSVLANAIKLQLLIGKQDARKLVARDLECMQALTEYLATVEVSQMDEALRRLIREWERLRIRMLQSLRETNDVTAREWLDGWTISSESIIKSSLGVPSASDLATIVIDSVLNVVRISLKPGDFASHEAAEKLLLRAGAIRDLFPAADPDSAERSRCIAAAWYNSGAALFRNNFAVPALPFVKSSAHSGREALSHRPANAETEELWVGLEEQLPKRWELLAACHLKKGEKIEALQAYMSSLTAFTRGHIDGIRRQSDTKPASAIFSSPSTIGTAIIRMASLLQNESTLFLYEAKTFEIILDNVMDGYVAIAMEYAVELMQSAEYRNEVAELMGRILQHLLKFYVHDQFPIRRLRVLARLSELNVSTGLFDDQAIEWIQDATELSERLDFGKDDRLSVYRQQYSLSNKMSRATRAYYRPLASSSKLFSILSQGVQDQLASLVKSFASAHTKNKAVAREVVFDNRQRLCERLSHFSAMLIITSSSLDGIRCLRLLRKLQRLDPPMATEYAVTSTRLATEYLRLGQVDQALNILSQAQSTTVSLSEQEQIEFDLCHARALAEFGNKEKGLEVYKHAQMVLETMDDLKPLSSTAKIHRHALKLYNSASAHLLTAEICLSEDNAVGAYGSISACFRLLNRATDTMARIAYKPNPSPPTEVFEYHSTSTGDTSADMSNIVRPRSRIPELSLRITASALETTFLLARTTLDRGSAKEAESFIAQAKKLATALGSARYLCRAEYSSAQLYRLTGQYDRAMEAVDRAVAVLGNILDKDTLDCDRIRHGIELQRGADFEASETLQRLKDVMARLEDELSEVEDLASSRLSHASPRPQFLMRRGLKEDTAASILREKLRACRSVDGAALDFDQLQQEAAQLASSTKLLATQQHLFGSITLAQTLRMFRNDLFLNSLMDSTISLPVGCMNNLDELVKTSRTDMVQSLDSAKSAFQRYLKVQANSGPVDDVRFATVASAMLRAYQACMGKDSLGNTVETAALLDRACAITLSRELLDSLQSRKRDPQEDLTIWPSFDHNVEVEAKETAMFQRHDNRHKRSEVPDMSTAPSNWVIIHMNFSEDLNTLFISRHQRDRDPIIFCLPIDRQGKREDEDESFTLQDAIDELRSIIESSDNSAKNAKNVDSSDRSAVVDWWQERKALDKRMEELLRNIEFCWLGAFKTIFNQLSHNDPESSAAFRRSLDKAFRRGLSSIQNKNGHIRLDPSIFDCFSTLSSKSVVQELEDLVYFILDLHQFNGQPVAIAEVDIDQLSLDVQTALHNFEASQRTATPASSEEQLFLVLDRKAQEIPWESMPILRGRSVSRIPSIAFLFDRLECMSIVQTRLSESNRVFYILNPSLDLINTQDRFEPWLKRMSEERGWTGIIGREPTEMELAAAFQANDLVLYFGHGGMEQFIRTQKIRSLDRCATMMLWGCSSGVLKDMGDLDPIGTPLNYMLAGSPSWMGNLWDVTDKDIDKLTTSVFEHTGLCEPIEGQSMVKEPLSTMEALAKSRSVCKLKYLTGAAPVHYGIPMYLAPSSV